MKETLTIMNQFALLELKLGNDKDESIQRIIQRIKAVWEGMGLVYQLPIGEKYTDTRTDVMANIVGEMASEMTITQIVKPIIYQNNVIVQQGIVMVEAKKK